MNFLTLANAIRDTNLDDDEQDAPPGAPLPPAPPGLPPDLSPAPTSPVAVAAAAPAPPPPRPRGFGAGLDDDALKQAQQQQAMAGWRANNLRIGDTIARAFSATGSDGEMAKALEGQGGQGVQNILARRKAFTENQALIRSQGQDAREAQKDDASSPQSKAARELVKQALPGVAASLGPAFEQMSHRQITENFPFMKELIDRGQAAEVAKLKLAQDAEEKKAAREDRAAQAKEHNETLLAMNANNHPAEGEWTTAQDTKTGRLFRVNKRTGQTVAIDSPPPAPTGSDGKPLPSMKEGDWHKFIADLNSGGARAGELGQNQKRINTAGRLEQLARDAHGSVANLNAQQMQELATSLQTLLSPGGHSTTEVEHLVPETYAGNVQGFLQKLLNEPRGTNQQAFVKQMLETAERERKAAEASNRDMRLSILPGFSPYRRADKARFDGILRGHSIDPDELDDSLLPKAAKTAGGAATAKPDLQQRIGELKAQGLSKDDIKMQLQKEGLTGG